MLTFFSLRGRSNGYWMLLVALTLIFLFGLFAAHYMESEGHRVTGMTNQVMWGIPHVVAVFLILAASGVLHVASMASVFRRNAYKSLARLSGLLSIALLLGGLLVLVLDLGRPDRLIVAMTTFNFRSIFAWNIFLYTGFMLVIAIYLWVMFEPRMNRYVGAVGVLAFSWRLVLTTGTGSIFALLVAREAYDTVIMVPLFILHSLSLGTAVFLLVAGAAFRSGGITLDPVLLQRLSRLLGWFVLAVLSMVAIYHLANVYVAGHREIERFILREGGVYTVLFWGGQIILGSLVPAYLLFKRKKVHLPRVLVAAALVVFGGFAQIYVLIIGGQAYPLHIVLGYKVLGGWRGHKIAEYLPTLPEFGLGFGGLAFALLLTLVGLRVLPFLPAGHKTVSEVD